MKTDIAQVGILGLSFSRALDQTWFNLWRKPRELIMGVIEAIRTREPEFARCFPEFR